MTNHDLILKTCSFCNLLKGCYPDYHSTSEYESKVLLHMIQEHHISLLKDSLIFINDKATVNQNQNWEGLEEFKP